MFRSSFVCFSASAGVTCKLKDVYFCSCWPNSRCRPLTCILAVVAMFLGSTSLAISSLKNMWNVSPLIFVLIYQNHVTSSPGVLLVAYRPFFSGIYTVILTLFSTYPKHLSNLENANWLLHVWRISCGTWANLEKHKCRNIWMNDSLFCVTLDMKMEQSNCGNYKIASVK